MKLLLVSIVILVGVGIGHAKETLTEKGQAVANTAARKVKKGVNKTQEALCGTLTGDNKVECFAKKAKNRIVEGKSAVVDKANEVKNNIDGH